ncbi:MAG: diguanylate cyclase [Treponemataceae bacterium]|nr:diguanylate cyclase [Treponemataceae bacterium]
MYKNIVTGKTLATEIFSTITLDAVDYINFYGVTENFSQKFTEYVQNKNEIAGLIIMQDSSSCFAYPVSSSIIQFDNFGEPIIKGNSPIFTIFSSTLPVDNYVGLNITTAVYLIQPSKIFSLARTSFLIILVATAIVFIVIMIQYKKDDSINYNSENFIKETSISQHTDNSNDLENQTSSNYVSTENDNHVDNEIILEEENQIDNDLELDQNLETEQAPKFKPFASNISDPQGLFSEFTGFGWESYLETRLDSELARAASSEQDLSFFLIAIENFDFNNQIIPQLTSILLERFKFRDLVFEYGTNGFAAILQGMNLDRAMALSQDLYTQISALLVNNQMNNKFGIGITTRSLRLITGNRLIDEAQQALNKAFDEEGLPIVAFRVNPEKYRQYLSDNE